MIDTVKDSVYNTRSMKKIRIYRILFMLASIITPVFGLIWSVVHSGFDIVGISSIVLTVYYAIIFYLSFKNKYVAERLNYFLYAVNYIVSLFAVYVAYIYKFSEGYALLLMLVIFYIILTFNNLRNLILYLACTTITIIGALYLTSIQGDRNINYLLLAVYLSLSVIAFFNLYLRTDLQKELIEAESKYRGLIEGALAGVFIIEGERIKYINPYLEELIGCSIDEIYNKSIFDFIYEDDNKIAGDVIDKLLSGEKKVSTEIRMVAADNSIKHVQFEIADIIFNSKHALIGTLIDITERKNAETKITYLAYHDTLTDLPNRNVLYKYLKDAIDEIRETGYRLAVVFIDLDNFKTINDTMGHDLGDIVLKLAAERLSNGIRETDFLARLSGDEFIIVLKYKTEDEINRLALRIIDEYKNPFQINGKEVLITPSIGISLCPTDGDDAETLIRNADKAMYLSKEQGRNTYRYYNMAE